VLDRTTTALLDALTDPASNTVWTEFDTRFRPVITALARRLGLSEADAADAAQETLARFLAAYRAGKYDRARGRLSSWVIGIARHCILDLRQARAARHEARGLSAADDLPADDELQVAWDAECRLAIVHRALELLRARTATDEKTLRAFERVALDGHSPADVARELRMTTADVYLAKHRCLSRLRELISTLSVAYEIV
jgi:RNA polymerase sigma-70 factor (ECF subfamily)